MTVQPRSRPLIHAGRGHPDYDRRDLIAMCQLLSVTARYLSECSTGTEMIVYDTQAVFYRTLTWAVYALLGAGLLLLLASRVTL